MVAGSVSLQADALDFLGDAANYGISLYVISHSIKVRAYTALFKSFTMLIFGVWVISQTIYKIYIGTPPAAEIMGMIGLIALLMNVICFYLLSKHSRSDSNRQSAWICSRNDAVGNIAVVIAAFMVYYTSSIWPDIIVAIMIAGMAILGAYQVTKQAIKEIADARH